MPASTPTPSAPVWANSPAGGAPSPEPAEAGATSWDTPAPLPVAHDTDEPGTTSPVCPVGVCWALAVGVCCVAPIGA